MSNSPLGLYAYPWDVVDEGTPAVLDAVERAGLNSLYIVLWYHSGMFFLPHNPVRRVYFPTPGALYFDPGNWHDEHALAPPISDICEDWNAFWPGLKDAADARGITLSAWMPILHNSGVGNAHPEVAVRNAWGDPIYHTLCPSNTSVCDLVSRVAGDVAKLGIFDRILFESIEYLPLRHDHHHEVIGVPLRADIEFLASLCFCPACMNRLQSNDLDAEAIRGWTRQTVDGSHHENTEVQFDWVRLEASLDGRIGAYLRVRESGITGVTQRIVESVRATAPKTVVSALDFGPLYPLGPNSGKWQNGVNLEAVLPLFDEIHPTYYFTDAGLLSERVSMYNSVLPDEIHQVPAVRAVLPQTESAAGLIEQLSLIAPSASGLSFYNYSFMNHVTLDWIRTAIHAHPPGRG